MNSAHWHLLLNHLPVVGTFFSTIILACGLIFRNDTLKYTGLFFFIATALFAIPVFLTGEGAEDVLKAIGQANKTIIHRHEDISEIAFQLSISIALLSIGTSFAYYRRKKYAKILLVIVLIAGLGNSVVMVIAGNSGGEIRHTEIRSL